MKKNLFKWVFALGFIFTSLLTYSQCEILNRIYPDGTMHFYIEPVNFYWTKTKALKGGIVTDKENYFLSLQPSPLPDKQTGKKIKDDLELKLSNDTVYRLEHFDTRYIDHDTVIQLLYLVGKKDMGALLNFEAVSVNINMMGTEGIRTYTFKLHKAAIKEQLECLIKDQQDDKK